MGTRRNINYCKRTGVSTFIRLLYLFFSGAHDFQLQAAQAEAQTKACKRASTFPTQTKLN
jgi:hypothetical protein